MGESSIAQVIFAGLAIPRWLPLAGISADHTRYEATIEALEAEYSYDLAGAQADIVAEMSAMGAVLQSGTWNYGGEELTIIVLNRLYSRWADKPTVAANFGDARSPVHDILRKPQRWRQRRFTP
jgi:hypothetical protein